MKTCRRGHVHDAERCRQCDRERSHRYVLSGANKKNCRRYSMTAKGRKAKRKSMRRYLAGKRALTLWLDAAEHAAFRRLVGPQKFSEAVRRMIRELLKQREASCGTQSP